MYAFCMRHESTTSPESADGVSGGRLVGAVARPDVSVAQIVLFILSKAGNLPFHAIRNHPEARQFGAQRSESSFYTALARLKRRRLVARLPGHGYELTSAGEYAALKAYVRRELSVAERGVRSGVSGKRSAARIGQSWDGRWRIVVFDIPESHRPIRDYLRTLLKRIGFKEFQRSMWMYPHKLPPFLHKLFADSQLRSYVRAMTTYDIDYDDDLRRQFKLT
jgi:hypothetical protein